MTDRYENPAANAENPPSVRIHDNQRAGDLGNLTEGKGRRRVTGGSCFGFGRWRADRLDHYDVARFDYISSAARVRPEVTITVPRPCPAHG